MPNLLKYVPGNAVASFSRASVANQRNPSQALVQVSAGVLRQDHYDPLSSTDRTTLIEVTRTNFLLNSSAPATQTVTLTGGSSGVNYVLWVNGTGSCAVSGGPTGTATDGSPVHFVLTANTAVTFTVSGTLTRFQCESLVGSANTAQPSSYIETTTASVTRSTDLANLGNPGTPQNLTVYVKWVERGSAFENNARTFQIGSGDTNPRLLLFTDRVTSRLKFIHTNSGGVGSTSEMLLPAVGDVVEFRGVVGADGAVQGFLTINGGTETAGTAGTAAALDANWSAAQFWLGQRSDAARGGINAFHAVSVEQGTQTLAFMRSTVATAGPWEDIANVGDVAAFSNTTTIEAGGTYEYRIYPRSAAGEGAASNIASATAPAASNNKAGSALVSGKGVPTATGRKSSARTAIVSGKGTNTATGRKSTARTAVVSGKGAVTATGTKSVVINKSGTALVSGKGSTVATGRKRATRTAVVSGAGTNTATGTKTVTQTVTTYAEDTFTRTVVDAWGTANTGGAWTAVGGVAANYQVNGTRGIMSAGAGNARLMVLPGIGQADVDITATVSTDKAVAGGGHVLYPVGRYVDNSNYYRPRVIFNPDGTTKMAFAKVVAGTASDFGTAESGVTNVPHSAGTDFRIRYQIQGTTHRFKVWSAANAEPAAWDNEATDTSITAAGGVGLRFFLQTAATNAPVAASWDNLKATSIPAATSNAKSGTALVSGRGTNTATGRKAASRTALVSGKGNTTATGRENASRAVVISGKGTVAVATRKTVSRTALVSGKGTVTATGSASVVVSKSGSALVSGKGNVVAAVRKGTSRTVGISGGGAVSATGREGARVAVLVSGRGNVVATARKAVSRSVLISGKGNVTVSVGTGVSGHALVSGKGSTTASGSKRTRRSLVISGGGAVQVSGRENASRAVQVTGGGSVTVGRSTGRRVAVLISGRGTVAVKAHKLATRTAVVSGKGNVTATGSASSTVSKAGSALVSGKGAITATARKAVGKPALVSGGGSVRVSTSVGAAVAARVSGKGNVTAQVRKSTRRAILVSGKGTTTASATKRGRSAPTVSGGGSVVPVGYRIARAQAIISGGGILRGVGNKQGRAIARVSGGGIVAGTLIVVVPYGTAYQSIALEASSTAATGFASNTTAAGSAPGRSFRGAPSKTFVGG